MNKLSQFFSVFVNSFAWQTLILALLNVFLGSGFVFNAYSVIQCFIVALVISVLMFVTDMILSKGFKLKLSLLTVSIIDILEVFAVVMVVGGAIFGWFDFVMSDLLIAAGVIIAVFLICLLYTSAFKSRYQFACKTKNRLTRKLIRFLWCE